MEEEYTYHYGASREYAEQLGMSWMEEWVPAIDKLFAEMGLSQDEVDLLMREYMWRIKHLFTTSNYTFWQRVKIALYFLLGR